MFKNQGQPLFHALDKRRRELRMSYTVLAKRSGVSMPTVVRTLSGRNPHAGIANVLAIAEVLGMDMKLEPNMGAHELLEKQAKQKAQQLVGMVQGTSALEAQALDDEVLGDMVRQTIHELLAGSGQRLWDE